MLTEVRCLGLFLAQGNTDSANVQYCIKVDVHTIKDESIRAERAQRIKEVRSVKVNKGMINVTIMKC